MSVEDWARREAENRYPTRLPYNARFERMLAAQEGFQDGARQAFDALLSDEAILAVRSVVSERHGEWLTEATISAALQAAVRAVTDPKTHDSSTMRTGEQ